MGEWSTPEGQPAGRPIHVYPISDIREHVTNGDPCPCMPMVRHPAAVQEEDGSWSQPDESLATIVHHAYDAREVGEVCRLALDQLGKALADHGHTWSPDERFNYEHAIHVLNMHYPPKP